MRFGQWFSLIASAALFFFSGALSENSAWKGEPDLPWGMIAGGIFCLVLGAMEFDR